MWKLWILVVGGEFSHYQTELFIEGIDYCMPFFCKSRPKMITYRQLLNFLYIYWRCYWHCCTILPTIKTLTMNWNYSTSLNLKYILTYKTRSIFLTFQTILLYLAILYKNILRLTRSYYTSLLSILRMSSYKNYILCRNVTKNRQLPTQILQIKYILNYLIYWKVFRYYCKFINILNSLSYLHSNNVLIKLLANTFI